MTGAPRKALTSLKVSNEIVTYSTPNSHVFGIHFTSITSRWWNNWRSRSFRGQVAQTGCEKWTSAFPPHIDLGDGISDLERAIPYRVAFHLSRERGFIWAAGAVFCEYLHFREEELWKEYSTCATAARRQDGRRRMQCKESLDHLYSSSLAAAPLTATER